ncbi:ATP/ADP translocase [Desulfocurvibacter africanus PCS]|uniref:ADP,ATP carrier protein n=2 Tax=Desulfocurvibacter africanus TaxID=873 RepID=M5Q1E1_DESAF|nr:ATP/ADP translocase [Desulfocurvibacter africanus PCS]
MRERQDHARPGCAMRHTALRKHGLRAGFLFANFFLIVMALYQLKPASRSLFIDALGADMLPWVWIGTAAAMTAVISFYNGLVERMSRLRIVLGSCLACMIMLAFFRLMLGRPGPLGAAAFYIFVDILGVVLTEQFWSLTNSVHTLEEGKSWYGLIGTGGLLGGLISGAFGGWLVSRAGLATVDLLMVAAAIIGAIFGLTWLMGRLGLYCEAEATVKEKVAAGSPWAILRNRYLALIAVLLLLGQLASLFVEFQFMKTLEQTITGRDARTAYMSVFFSIMSLVAIGVNLTLTPLVVRLKGVLAGLLVQPVVMGVCALLYMAHPTLLFGSLAKISDRGLSYSINRASRELLYVPVDPVVIYQAKAWIDMFGYRLFEVLGSLLILAVTQWASAPMGLPGISAFTLAACGAWIAIVLLMRQEYSDVVME